MERDRQLSFYWHDYETFGRDQRTDRPAQFSGQRTDLALRPLGEPDLWYCRPAPDCLPDPEACLLTGITPRLAGSRPNALSEWDFARAIATAMSLPGTISVGYNSFRFDDEVSRFLFWRNLLDPYARERGGGRSRWDLFPFTRAVWALRPEGVTWPRRDDGQVSFRLEHLARANGLIQPRPHDATSDVRATIELAALLRARQPRLWSYALPLRDKREARSRLRDGQPCLWIDGWAGQERSFTRLIAPLAELAQHPNEILVWDLSLDPGALAGLAPDEIWARLRARRDPAAAPDPVAAGLRRLRINASPFLCPDTRVLGPEAWRARGLPDAETARRHLEALSRLPGRWREELVHFDAWRDAEEEPDPEVALYAGGYPNDHDRALRDSLYGLSPREIEARHDRGELSFQDPRLAELLRRARWRCWPELLGPSERAAGRAFCRRRLAGQGPDRRGLTEYRAEIGAERDRCRLALAEGTIEPSEASRREEILAELWAWGEEVAARAADPADTEERDHV